VEAKDTVMSEGERLAIIQSLKVGASIAEHIAEAQAEISFKAGLAVNDTRATAAEIAGDALESKCNELTNELTLSKAEAEGYLSQLLDVQKDCIKARKAGIREVVEWIDGQIKEDEEELRLLDMQRQPLVDKIGYVPLTPEEDRQVMSLGIERTYIESGISRLNRLRQAKLKEWEV